MKYRLLGRSGLRVSEVALGAMTFGDDWGWGAPKDEARAIYDAYRAAGGNFIDTANVYTSGTSESMIGEFIRDHRQSMVVATKYTCAMTNGDVNAGGNHRKNMVQSLYRRSAPTQPPRVCALVGDDPYRGPESSGSPLRSKRSAAAGAASASWILFKTYAAGFPDSTFGRRHKQTHRSGFLSPWLLSIVSHSGACLISRQSSSHSAV
jgi:Aldo/keto reductase family